MNRWTRANLLLALFTSLLLAALYWPAGTQTGPRLTQLDPADITAIRIERGKRLALALQRTGAGWQIRYPAAGAANQQRVRRLLAVADAPAQQQFGADDLDRYGLDDPVAVVQFDQQRLAFGDRDPAQRGRYVLHDGRITLIDDVFYSLLTLPVSHYSEP